MSNDPRYCHVCKQYTAYFDKVDLVWKCPCGWRERRARGICPLGSWPALACLTCVLIWSDAYAVPGLAAYTQEWRGQVCTGELGDPDRIDVTIQRRLLLGDAEINGWSTQGYWSNRQSHNPLTPGGL